ncbi:MAG: flagellar biosynthetic protein FliO [Alphaproteobacteria bacterium]|nr:flagellar biosynthetic protein FliO [Alphaproteobacteria bacterium]
MTPDPESVSWVQIVVAVAVVTGLLASFGLVLKYIKARGLTVPGLALRPAGRLQVVESLALDMRRRLVIVRCDGEDHLLLLGNQQDIVVKNSLKPASSPPS